MVARARGGFHHGMDPAKPPAANLNISSYFSFCGFSLFLGAGSAFADPHPHFRRSHPRPPFEIIAKAPPAGPSTSSRQYRCAVQSAISSPFLARLPPSSPSTVDTRHWMEIPRACRSSKTLQRMLRASATSETVHGPNRAIRRMRGCRAPLTPSGHDVFAAGCAFPGGTSCSRLTGSKVSVRRPASVDSATHPARRSPIGARWSHSPFDHSVQASCRDAGARSSSSKTTLRESCDACRSHWRRPYRCGRRHLQSGRQLVRQGGGNCPFSVGVPKQPTDIGHQRSKKPYALVP